MSDAEGRMDEPTEIRSPASAGAFEDFDEGGALGKSQQPPPLSIPYSARQVKRVRDLLTKLSAARRSARFYPMDHPATIEAVQALGAVVRKYHEEGVDVSLAFFEGEVLLGEQLLPEESIAFDQLIREFTSMGAGSIVIRRGADNSELSRMISLLSADSYEVENAGGMKRMADEACLPHIVIGEIKVFERSESGDDPEKAREAYRDSVDLMREVDTLLRHNEAVNASQVRGVVRGLVDNVLSNKEAMLALSGLKSYDEYTFYHSANVALLALALGSMVTQDYRFLSALGTGALLHDVGKMTIDLDILNKPDAFSPKEWAIMRQHPVRGAERVAVVSGLDRAAVVVVLEHHMRFDGSGYPKTPIVRHQHLASRIVAIADAYDAMTSRRSYSAARRPDEAMAILVKGAGSAVDPVLTRMFVSMLGVYPPRTVVRLSDGSTAVVVKPVEGNVTRPVVRVIAAPDGSMLEPREVDLASEAALDIAGTLDATALNVDIEDFL